jgi:hypothetical protein
MATAATAGIDLRFMANLPSAQQVERRREIGSPANRITGN